MYKGAQQETVALSVKRWDHVRVESLAVCDCNGSYYQYAAGWIAVGITV